MSEKQVTFESLTGKQQLFVSEYLIDFNATQAAIRAGYSVKTAEVMGSKLLKNPRIKPFIDIELDRRQNENRIDAEKVIEGLHELAFKKKDISDANRIRALELLGKHFGVFSINNDDSSTEIKITLPQGMNLPT